MATARQVVLVGHCGFDQTMLEDLVRRAAGAGVSVVSANDGDELARFSLQGSLLLVNRRLDGRFATDSGVELIGQLSGRGGDCPAAMLVSNDADAQVQAVAAGGLAGFGKSQLDDAATVALLKQALGG